MSRQRKRHLRFATFVIVPAVLLLAALVPALLSSEARALDATQWDKVRGYINEYFGGPQAANTASNGEAGFRISKTNLWNRLDSNGDINPAPIAGAVPATPGVTVTGVAGEGDDMANRPVLIDNLMGRADVIPGTEFRCNWNTGESCFGDASITAIRQIVDNHQAAGFSTDIVDYCVSAQTAGPTTGGFGIIAQVPGGLASDTSLTPNVYTLDYARNGWRNAPPAALNTANAIAAPETSAGGFAAPGTVANCDAAATDYELVRCQANWAIDAAGGNVGNGSMVLADITGAGQSVDVRTGTISTMATAGTNLQIPIGTLFSTSGLANLNPLSTTVLAGRTQMGSNGAIGLRMLGYSMITNGSISTGFARWNSSGTDVEQQVNDSTGLPVQSIAAFATAGKVDETGPSVASVAAENMTATSADIHRVALEPATLKVEYGTAPDALTGIENHTVLNADKTVTLSGLSGYTHYYYRATSYDGYANATVNTVHDFWTLDGTAPVVTYVSPTNWVGDNTPTITVSATDAETGITGATMSIDGGGSTGCNISALPVVTCPAVAGLGEGSHTVVITATNGDGLTGHNDPAGSFSVDTGAPTTTDNVPAGWQPGAVEVTLSCVDADSGCASTTYELDGGGTQTGTTVSVPATSGSHTIVYRSTDNAGNVESNQNATVQVDVTDPVISNNQPTGTTGDTTPTISADHSDAHSGIDTTSVTLDGVDMGAACNYFGPNVSCTPASSLSDGVHNVVVTVTDNTGNEAQLPWSFTVNSAAPVIDLNYPGTGGWSSTSIPTVTMTYHAGGTIDAASLEIDGTPCAGQTWDQTQVTCTAPILSDGMHNVHGSVSVGANEATRNWYFQVDTTAPTTTDNAPASWQNAAFNVTLNCSDQEIDPGIAGSGCGPTYWRIGIGGWSTGTTVPIDTEGDHTLEYYSSDVLDNSENITTKQVQLDLTDPTAQNVLPSGTLTNNSPDITFEANDALSGLNDTQLTITLDGSVIGAGCSLNGSNPTTVRCTTLGLSDGMHNILATATDNAGNVATTSGSFTIDTEEPSVTNISPSGTIHVANPTVTADVLDGSGVGTTTVTLDGDPLTCDVSDISGGKHLSCSTSGLTEGTHNLLFNSADTLGNSLIDYPATFNIVFQITYYWNWYDDVNADNWVLMANTDVVNSANYTLSIDGVDKALPGGGTVAPGDIAYSQFGDMGGPVKAVSTNGVSGLLSQRTLWPKGGNSFEEVLATEESDLSNHYWWPWYDELSSGFQNWIIISNPNGTPVTYTIEIGGVVMPTTADNPGTIPAGGTVTPRFDDVRDGPVELNATGNVIASQRVLSNYGTAFNEEPGIPNGDLMSEYYWTWYDDLSPEAMNWILIANPNGTEVTYTVEIDGAVMPTTADNPGTIAAGEIVTPRFEGVRGGYVKVTSTGGNVIASQRTIWGSSFEEVPGVGTLSNDYLFSWYDESASDVMDWVLVSNTNDYTVHYQIKIAGEIKAEGEVPAGESISERFGIMGGPVEVIATDVTGHVPANVLSSQRVLWKGYFNEVLGYKFVCPDWHCNVTVPPPPA